ncbi:MAG TPA: hypothetical protein DEQ80_10900 [Anaerolinea thermolimosa]|uniref:Glycosyltransferase RgtA/B/C/D-like domain-containing protein n=1 Tax=Anaerolinea thermolimosa TaxID=229919 RepID=A0A3D1JJE3_9CHLR|nr:hypothetical protein [Anaerolinea thermolimosa]
MVTPKTINLEQPERGVPPALWVERFFCLFLVILAVPAIRQLFEIGSMSGRAVGFYSWQWVGLLAVAILLALAQVLVAVSLFTPLSGRLCSLVARLSTWAGRWAWVGLAGFGLTWVVYVGVVLWRFDQHFAAPYPRLWLFGLTTGVGAFFLTARWRKLPVFWAVLVSALVYGFGLKALSFLPDVSTYPFSLSWSEASRYYYASLPYARRLYGFSIPLSALHPSRYLLLGLPFLLGGTPLWLHRLWQVFLWLGMSLAAGWALMRTLRPPNRWVSLIGVIWAALFLLQGPVYYHLLVCVVLVLVGFDRQRYGKTLFFVVLASLWAGISRVNWFPVPAMLAAVLYFLETPVQTSRSWWQYLLRPLGWGVAGLAAALAAQAAYVLVSGHEDTSGFASTFTSALLWYRLLPNPTYPMGVLPAILLITAPALTFLGVSVGQNRKAWHPLRLLGLGAILAALFAGGLVVSTKIGGGSNIHNLDAYLVLVMVMVGGLWFGRGVSEEGGAAFAWRHWVLAVFLLVIPVAWNFNVGHPFAQRDARQAEADLKWLREFVTFHGQDGEVLFITQRQLLLFGEIPGIKLVPDYELLTLSEMAISNHQGYLERFREDLRNHRFRVIVTSMENEVVKDPEQSSFAEENNAWVENITVYIRKYYQTAFTLPVPNVEIFLPK